MYRSNTLARLVVVTWLVILDVSHITCRLYRPHLYTMTCVVTICDAYLCLPDISIIARSKHSNISNFVGVLYVPVIVRWYTLSLYRNGIVNAECILEHRRILAKYRSDTVANWCVVIWLVIVDVSAQAVTLTLFKFLYSSYSCNYDTADNNWYQTNSATAQYVRNNCFMFVLPYMRCLDTVQCCQSNRYPYAINAASGHIQQTIHHMYAINVNVVLWACMCVLLMYSRCGTAAYFGTVLGYYLPVAFTYCWKPHNVRW